MRLRTTPLVGAVFSQKDMSEHERQRCSFHDMCNEVAMGGCNGVFRKKVNGRADLGCLLPHRREVVARKSALPKQEANSFLNRPAFQHVRVKPAGELVLPMMRGYRKCLFRASYRSM